MRPPVFATRARTGALVVAVVLPCAAVADLPLVQYPPGSAVRLPAPNVMLSLDDSGSMGSAANDSSSLRSLKEVLHSVFGTNSAVLPDKAIRLGWNTFNACRVIPVDPGAVGCSPVRVLDAVHRKRFLDWVGPTNQDGPLKASGGTPTYSAYAAVGDYLKDAAAGDAKGPWAAVPGSTLEPVHTCRRNYIVLMTDGEANESEAITRGGGGNTRRSVTLPDGTRYNPASAETKLYLSSPDAKESLADLAFYYWSTDFLVGKDNNVPPVIRHSGAETVAGTSITLTEYWNPKNNPSTWQNATTYTIGFGPAASWTSAPSLNAPNTNMYAGDYPKMVSGAVRWPAPSASKDALLAQMWHMALAGRGRFIPAKSRQDLLNAFQDIFGAIVEDSNAPVTHFVSSASSIARDGAMRFTTGYEANGWLGYMRADTLAQLTAAATPAAGWGTKLVAPPATPHVTTADKLDALTPTELGSRLILTWSDEAKDPGGASFQWNAEANPKVRALSAAQKKLLGLTAAGSDDAALGAKRLAFIRGDRSEEGKSLGKRRSRQGDIVNSSPWYVAEPVGSHGQSGYLTFVGDNAKRLPMVYVGGNDGMLHGFSAVDGAEKIAYVPKGVLKTLAQLADPAYKHRYYVDGSPFSGDIYEKDGSAPGWYTMLVGTLGAGGKGYFVLDVTHPGSTAADGKASELLKTNAHKLVVMDQTEPAGSTAGDADIGHIMAAPVVEEGNPRKTVQIARLNDGRWAALMGNGVNSRAGRPVLLIQYLDGDRSLRKISAATSGEEATGNGLSAPQPLDIDGNGTPDVVYAGDLRGNLWKFDLISRTASDWRVAFDTRPLFVAAHGSGNARTRQPITAPPLVRTNDRGVGGVMVAFGTGRNVTEDDRTSTARQSLYSVHDDTRYKLGSDGALQIDTSMPRNTVSGTGELVQQSLGTAVAASSTTAQRRFWTMSSLAVAFAGTGAKKGWYLDLPVDGERLLAQFGSFDGSNIIEVLTQVPAAGGHAAQEQCAATVAQQTTYRTLLNIVDGRPPSVPVLDANGDGNYTLAGDRGASRMTAAANETSVRNRMHELRIGADGVTDKLSRLPELVLRGNWRQLK